VISVYGCQQKFGATYWALVLKPFFYAMTPRSMPVAVGFYIGIGIAILY
jgi:hypothetical protein